MKDEKLFSTIKELKKIEPDSNWVVFTKTQILISNQSEKISVFTAFQKVLFRPAYAGVLAGVSLFLGFMNLSLNALPGETLYTVKKTIENAETKLVYSNNKSERDFDLANKRLEELNKLALNNKEKTEPAINEFKVKTSEIAKELFATEKVDQALVEQAKKLGQNKEEVEQVLAAKIETEEYDWALATLVRLQIEDLQERTLTEEQQEFLNEATDDFLARDLGTALEKVYYLSNLNLIKSIDDAQDKEQVEEVDLNE